jgi:hypothetical protein
MGMPTGGDGDPSASVARLVRIAVDAGADGAFLASGVFVGQVGSVTATLLAAGLGVAAMSLPLPDRALPPGGRLPHLGAIHADERAAALELATQAMAAGASVGATRALLDFGAVSLPVRRADLARSFGRRELGEDDPGRALLDDALGARKAVAPRLHDACRWSLERLARDAERRGVTLLLHPGATPWDTPTPREALALLEAFRGAPLAIAFDPGRLSVLRALDLPLSDGAARALAAAAGAVVENDAVGMQAGYLAGLGERDDTLPAVAELPAAAPVILTSAVEVTGAELAAAVARIRAGYG